jgi:hypothetical protein
MKTVIVLSVLLFLPSSDLMSLSGKCDNCEKKLSGDC